MGQILWLEAGARDPKLFQVSDIDTGAIRWVNGGSYIPERMAVITA